MGKELSYPREEIDCIVIELERRVGRIVDTIGSV